MLQTAPTAQPAAIFAIKNKTTFTTGSFKTNNSKKEAAETAYIIQEIFIPLCMNLSNNNKVINGAKRPENDIIE